MLRPSATHPRAIPGTPPAESYADIFAQRGHLYHEAMTRVPRARDDELGRAVAYAEVRPGHRVCDLPSGAGYLARHLPPRAFVVHVETAPVFARLCRAAGGRVLLGGFADVPLRDASVDRVISLAALHHVDAKARFYAEARRVLVPGGILCVGDVRRGSAVAEFLNGFVDAHNSMGHRGTFLTPETAADLERVGFVVAASHVVPLRWHFATADEMLGFVGPLFGVDRASPDQLLRGIERTVGWEQDADGCRMHWELLYLQAHRRP